MEGKTKTFEQAKIEMKEKLETKPYFIEQLKESSVHYIEGKYINSKKYIDNPYFFDVHFEEETIYKTWWYSNDRSWEPDPAVLVYVEIAGDDAEHMYNKAISSIDKKIEKLKLKRNEIVLQERMPSDYHVQ